MYTGYSFTTGNSVVRKLNPGSTLRVTSSGTLVVTHAAPPPEVIFNEGDSIYVRSKGRNGTVVRMTSVLGSPAGFNPKTQILYIGPSGEPPIIRVADKTDVTKY